jgi:hypothetical protein
VAKIFDPSGETEFFEITELQQAFEKELKSGEKVTFNAGIKEGSILREAPIRADLAGFFQEFKDRILNPYIPPQPSVTRFQCTAVVRPITLNIFPSYVEPNGASDLSTPYLQFTTVLNTLSGFYNVPQINTDFEGIFDGSAYNFTPLPYAQTQNRTHPSAVQIIVPDYYTLTGYVFDWDWDNPALPIVSMDGIDITTGLGGGVSYFSGAITCNNIPNSIPPTPIFELKADLFVPAYYNTPYPYSLTACSYTLFNYSFTNFFP